MKKKSGEMTFKEFFDLAEDEATKQYFLMTLKKEAFTEEQINEMKMEKVWKLFLDSYAIDMDHIMTSMSVILEKKPELAPVVDPILKELIRQLEELIRKLEDEEKRRKENSP